MRTWAYFWCWAALAIFGPSWSTNYSSFRLGPAVIGLLIVFPWVVDLVLARRAVRATRWTVFARLFNILPMLVFLANAVLVWVMSREPEVRHNSDHKMAAQLLGADAPILETWYSQDTVFTGHGGEFLRLRFQRERRAEIEAMLASHCRVSPEVRWSAIRTSRPVAKSMPWDPPSTPAAMVVCGVDPGFQTAFGSSGDSLLLYYEGH